MKIKEKTINKGLYEFKMGRRTFLKCGPRTKPKQKMYLDYLKESDYSKRFKRFWVGELTGKSKMRWS